ncbi:DnaA ATPase domain-containing protein [Megasphaera cerevisiae]|uniref:DnaA ATPase domain-containing protein n=1 Tax=Megasphaera cerevisiae TaxID=39029 RepID=UPI00065AFC81|nr:DnaA/Hda family protein [Megasphaera cerevisiae]SJZ60735.1 DNA replication protein DnaC [Megasphaera cerevisiae DSM 20462]
MQKAITDKERILQKVGYIHHLSQSEMNQVRPNAVRTLSTPPDGIKCEKCGNTGYIEGVHPEGYEIMEPCPLCYERRKIARRLRHSGVSPQDYDRYTLASFDGGRSEMSARMKALAEKYLHEHVTNGHGFGVFGSSGMGKTHICIAICQSLTRKYDEPHYYFSYRAEMPELIKSMRSFTAEYGKQIEKWKTCKNLYIDDLFKFSGKVQNGRLVNIDQDDLKVMFDIINARYLNHATTFFSSEYTVGDISKVDGAIGSRIFEMVEPYGLKVEGENERLKGA